MATILKRSYETILVRHSFCKFEFELDVGTFYVRNIASICNLQRTFLKELIIAYLNVYLQHIVTVIASVVCIEFEFNTKYAITCKVIQIAFCSNNTFLIHQ